MARIVGLAALILGAFAASHLLFRHGPKLVTEAAPVDPPRVVGSPRGAFTDPPGMVWVPRGAFTRGSDNPKMPDARPKHQVALGGFWMDRTAVTNEELELKGPHGAFAANGRQLSVLA